MLLLLAGLLLLPAALEQSNMGMMEGAAQDQTGARIPGASVTVIREGSD